MHSDQDKSRSGAGSSGAGKYVILALVVIIAAAGLWLWNHERSEPVAKPEAAPPPTVEREPPPPEKKEPTHHDIIPTTGILVVHSNVPGASVIVDGKTVGQAPFEDEYFAAGRFDIRVESDGYEPFVGKVHVRPGLTAELTATLERTPPSLRITSDVPGATVFLDRNYVGTTPVDVKAVKPGEHELTVSAEGFDMHTETVKVAEGQGHQDLAVSFKRAPELNERIAVVHKHGMGSCQGVLIADKNGLRYETDNKKDAFSVAYADLERFEVNYMDKNLNVKIRKGRNYNFTDQSGNPDALFVFHKNVQAYMERM